MSAQKPQRQTHAVRGVIFALCGGIGWGLSGACAQELFASEGLDPLWVSAVRMMVSGVVLSLFALVVKRSAFLQMWKSSKDVLQLVVVALFGLAFCQVSYLIAISYSNAGTATVLEYIGPVMIVVFLCLKGGRKPTKAELAAMILVVLGTFLLATHGNPSSMVLSKEGLFWGLISAFALALYTLLPGKLMLRYGSIVVVAGALLIDGVVFAVAIQPWNAGVQLDAHGWLILFGGLIVLGTIVAFSLYFQAVQDIGAAKTSLLASVETVSATLFAVLWLGTAFSWIDIVGFVCIMATVFILAKPKAQPLDTIEAKEQNKGNV